jgi:neutral trehalase
MSSSLENIYCRGPLLHAVQTIASSSSDDSKNTRGLFEDCKTFVDMALKFDAEVVLAEFRVLAEAPGGLKASKLKEFVEANFSAPGDDLEEYVLPELSRFSAVGSPMSAEVPEAALGLTAGVSDPALATWAQALCKLWPLLCRRVSAAGIEHSERRSLLPRTRPMMVPGGRFREVWPSLNALHYHHHKPADH